MKAVFACLFCLATIALDVRASESCGTGVSWAICSPSPNFNARKLAVNMIILHYTYLNDSESLSILTSSSSGVSAHYLVMLNGTLHQLVDEAGRAWHAGVALWKNETDINSLSIGIEITNYDGPDGRPLPYTPEQISTIVRLCSDIINRYDIQPERIVGHSDVAPLRKQDPGSHFPWNALYDNGIGHYVSPYPIEPNDPGLGLGSTGPKVSHVQKQLLNYGYGYATESGVYDEDTMTVVTAFQRHFRPELTNGQADSSTIETMDKLIATLSNSVPEVVTEAKSLLLLSAGLSYIGMLHLT